MTTFDDLPLPPPGFEFGLPLNPRAVTPNEISRVTTATSGLVPTTGGGITAVSVKLSGLLPGDLVVLKIAYTNQNFAPISVTDSHGTLYSREGVFGKAGMRDIWSAVVSFTGSTIVTVLFADIVAGTIVPFNVQAAVYRNAVSTHIFFTFASIFSGLQDLAADIAKNKDWLIGGAFSQNALSNTCITSFQNVLQNEQAITQISPPEGDQELLEDSGPLKRGIFNWRDLICSGNSGILLLEIARA